MVVFHKRQIQFDNMTLDLAIVFFPAIQCKNVEQVSLYTDTCEVDREMNTNVYIYLVISFRFLQT